MVEILTLITPIGILIGIGIGFVHFGLFPADGLPVMNQFVMNVCIPVLLFSAVTRGDSLGDFAWAQAMLYAAASLASVACLWLVLRYALREPLPQTIILSIAAGSSNSVFLGFPIAAAVIPDRATDVFGWVVLAEVLFIFPIVTTLALLADQSGEKIMARNLIKPFLLSPVSIGLFLGLAFLASDLVIPAPIEQVIGSITKAAPFLALFLIGGTLTQVELSRSGPRVISITVAKLFVHPLLVGAAFALVFGWNSATQKEALLFAAIPVFTTYVVFGGRHGVGDVAASAIVLSTAVGAITVTLLLGFMM